MFNFIDLNDPQIWVAVSFLLFFIIFGNFIWKKLSSFLDNKINTIQQEIVTASNLHQDAKNLLSEMQHCSGQIPLKGSLIGHFNNHC